MPGWLCICSGEAVVTQGGKEVNRLFKADFFGERALLVNEPRGATVSASQQTVCLVLDRETFTEILGPLEKALQVCRIVLLQAYTCVAPAYRFAVMVTDWVQAHVETLLYAHL